MRRRCCKPEGGRWFVFEKKESTVHVVTGKEHLNRILFGVRSVQEESASALHEYETHSALIGTALTALFEAATCHRGCNHGPHIFESVCARAYNLGASAYLLAASGFYDEAANLIRSLGEIANLVSLSVSDPVLFQEWLTSDSETRKKKFSPYKIRVGLEKSGGVQIADEGWYARFCEGYTHITPATKPGMHNDAGRGNAGGVYQAAGLRLALDELVTVIAALAMYVCKFFKFDDLFKELSRDFREVTSDADSSILS
jgi:hypothetical protein